MSVFADYARVYDLIYRDKDYAAEAAYAAARLRESSPRACSVLELGSGTGSHAIELGRLGFEVTGVDLSPQMVEHAEARRQALAPEARGRLGFHTGNACTVRLGRQFDAVLSLFHVLSYQTGDDAVAAMLATAAAHLRPGSPFFFDFWYGPAVLWMKPEVRTKILRDGAIEAVRVAEPTLREKENRVDVRLTVSIRGEGSPLVETHAMRYFFLPELESALARAGFDLMSAAEMGTGAPLGPQTWSGSALARKR